MTASDAQPGPRGARTRTAILISGRGSNMDSLIRAAATPGFPAEIVVVISNRPGAPGLEIARRAGVDALAIDHRPFGGDRRRHEEALDAALRARSVEIVCLAGYMRLLTPWFIGQWQGRLLNIHPSLLPALPGLDTHARALAEGRTVHGCTVHLVTDVMDEGPLIEQQAVPVLPGDDEPTLAARVLAQEHLLYPRALRRFIESLEPRPARRANRRLAAATRAALKRACVRERTDEHPAPDWSIAMAETVQRAPAAPSTEEGFLADRLSFWASATKFMTRVIIALVVLLVAMYWFLA